ncbi:MAG: hypothetical protein VBE63_27375 [Lamprobacter sp.]|uniref:hypothetical protein n=1 Tax=Lamprobacter sp. TaxID=3100796 RepID=UPI002B26055C|nr:hypothetical protein [Lamprobacter sp.]MEA3643621.1 hypothetical protein [Lamprobacter sp.]
MKRQQERIRIAKKQGWYRGYSKQDPLVLYDPETELGLCVAYDEGWSEGINAPDNATNPYGIYENNRAPKTGWYKYESMEKAHFFRKGCTSSFCGMVFFLAEKIEPISHPDVSIQCKSCRK